MWLTEFLGILGLERTAKTRHEEITLRLNSISERLELIAEHLANINQQLQVQHVGRKPVQAVAYDWEQVQAQELAEMLANPPKEEN